jgi:hypothetical protein
MSKEEFDFKGYKIRYMPGQEETDETPEQYQKRIAPLIRDAAESDPGEQYERFPRTACSSVW